MAGMTTPAPGWPTTAWSLTAPESYVLQHGPEADGGETFKLAVLELVTRGILKLVDVEERRAFGRTRTVPVLTPGPKASPPSEQALASVWLLYSGTALRLFGDVAGVPVVDLAQAAVRRYKNLARYRTEEVVAPLVDRRLFERQEYRILWLWPAQRVVITPAGERLRADLRQRLDLGTAQFGDWVDREPARAMAFAGLAGASLLLMSPLYPDLQRLRQMQPPPSSVGSDSTTATYTGDSTVLPSDGEGGPGWQLPDMGIDLGSLPSFDFDLSAFDSLSSAFDAIDSAVDSGGGDSGSDSGGDSGGDGGSSE
jgi:hypothetical protein